MLLSVGTEKGFGKVKPKHSLTTSFSTVGREGHLFTGKTLLESPQLIGNLCLTSESLLPDSRRQAKAFVAKFSSNQIY